MKADPVLGYAQIEGCELWIRGWSGRIVRKHLFAPELVKSGFEHYLFGLWWLTEPRSLVTLNILNTERPFLHRIPVEWDGDRWARSAPSTGGQG